MRRSYTANKESGAVFKRKEKTVKPMSFDSGLKGLGVVIRWNTELKIGK